MAKRRRKNEGCIYQRTNGRWVAQVRIQGKRLSKSFDNQKQCQLWIRQMQDQIQNGLTWEATRVTLGEYLLDWLESVDGSIRPKTLHQYEGCVRNHLMPHLGNVKLQELQPHQIQQTYTKLKEQGLGQRSVQLVHSILHRAMVMAEKQGLIGRNPASAVIPPKVVKKEMKILDESQAMQFLIAAHGDRYEALFHLAITTGMRQGELLGLKWGDIDWVSSSLNIKRQIQRVPGKGLQFSTPKTRAGWRMIQIGPESLHQLEQHRKHQDREKIRGGWNENDLVFPSVTGDPTDQRALHKIFKRLLIKANLPEIRFHDLRHTAATLMLLNGIPLIVVSRRLGHSKPSVTLDIYGHYLPGMQKQAAALMDELVTPIPIKWQQIGSS
jgi:integrase